MGFLDVIRGMQNGPRGDTSGTQTGPSKMTMALLALLAYKAYKSYSESHPSAAPQAEPNDPKAGGLGGGLGGLLGGLLGGNQTSNTPALPGGLGNLGGLLTGALGGSMAGGALGGLLGDGLKNLVNDMQSNGMGGHANSWVGTGPNEHIDKNDLAKAIGIDDIDHVSQQLGMSHDQFLSAIQSQLPGAVDELTPNGHIPSHDELARMV